MLLEINSSQLQLLFKISASSSQIKLLCGARVAFSPCLGRLPNMLMTLSPQVMVYFSMLGLGDHGMGQPKACMTLGFHDRWP